MKHLVDLDERALQTARDCLGTQTIKATVNAALHAASGRSIEKYDIDVGLDFLESFDFDDRSAAWR
ncbi:MAG: hypothetical protein ACRDPW_06120 [Mycobacteriales bacterium]